MENALGQEITQPADETTLKKMRHSFYDWLKELGMPEMGQGEANRARVSNFLKEYAGFHNDHLRKMVTTLSKTRADQRAARRRKLNGLE